MKKTIIFIASLLCSLSSLAVPVICYLSWSAPSDLADGAPLDPNRIAGYRVFIAVDEDLDVSGDYTVVQNNQGPQEINIDLDPRIEPYQLKFGVVAVLTDGKMSVMSAIGEYEFVLQSDSRPLPPTDLKIILECQAQGCEVIVL